MQCDDICNDTFVSKAAFGMYLARVRHQDFFSRGSAENLPANLDLTCLGVFLLATLQHSNLKHCTTNPQFIVTNSEGGGGRRSESYRELFKIL
jgi:hypothetical protein